MSKVFGYPKYDDNNIMQITKYDGDYAEMMMDVFVKKLAPGETFEIVREGEEIAALLLGGKVTFKWNDGQYVAFRKDVFEMASWALHVCSGDKIFIEAESESEVLIQCTHNKKKFPAKFYRPEDSPWSNSYEGKFGDVANRWVNTIFDYEHKPESNMVLGEIINKPGNWSGYLPHCHPQPEVYFFRFDRPEGFGASFVGDDVYKSVNNSFSAIPGGKLHPQSAAPGFKMWTCWMIRHLDDNPWLQTDRCEDERYTWLHKEKI